MPQLSSKNKISEGCKFAFTTETSTAGSARALPKSGWQMATEPGSLQADGVEPAAPRPGQLMVTRPRSLSYICRQELPEVSVPEVPMPEIPVPLQAGCLKVGMQG